MTGEIQSLASSEGDQAATLKEAEAKAKAANDKYLRLNADFDNFRKRSVRTLYRLNSLSLAYNFGRSRLIILEYYWYHISCMIGDLVSNTLSVASLSLEIV